MSVMIVTLIFVRRHLAEIGAITVRLGEIPDVKVLAGFGWLAKFGIRSEFSQPIVNG